MDVVGEGLLLSPQPRPFPCTGTLPGPRCGHTLTAVNYGVGAARLVLFGGATAVEGSQGDMPHTPGPGTSTVGIRLAGATSDVHILDVRSGCWEKMEPAGEAPSPRAAHAAAAVGSMVVVMGGIGPAGLASEDLHVLDFSDLEKPKWHRVMVPGPGPSARYAHTLALVANNYLVATGGNDGKQALEDTWALDTSAKPYKWHRISCAGDNPSPRMYAASAARGDGLLLLCGGRDAEGTPLDDAYGLGRLHGGRWEWALSPAGAMPTARYQHSAVFVGTSLYVSGGAVGDGGMVDEAESMAVLDTVEGRWHTSSEQANADWEWSKSRCRHAVAAVGPYVFIFGGLRGSDLLDDLLVTDESTTLESPFPHTPEPEPDVDVGKKGGNVEQQQKASKITPTTPSPGVQLHPYAVVVAKDITGAMKGLIMQLSITQLTYEHRRMMVDNAETPRKSLLDMHADDTIHKAVLRELLNPRHWTPPEESRFLLGASEISELCDQAESIFREESSVLKLCAPIKIFGDLHGQFGDLMRLFEEYGTPSTAGDITYIDYLFLGDYVDRGAYSLETICLLLALKIEHPKNVHLIRGNHEAADINALFGFRLECVDRLGEQQGIFVWERLNSLFNWLPLAAIIEDRIACMHGGIGHSIHSMDQIEQLERPLPINEGGNVLMDLLWSDPTANDSVEGVQPSPRGPGLVTFGPDRVKEFCENNNLQMIVRAHECVMDGFERFAQGRLITLFSATNYCGTANNAGAILVLGRDLKMVPKLIHPLPPNEQRSLNSDGEEEEPPTPHPNLDTWMQAVNQDRPPTPPRGRATSDSPSNAYF